MRCTISHARAHLCDLVTRAQDPREVIIRTRHGKPLAALISITEASRIWHLQEDDEIGWKHLLSGIRGMWSGGGTFRGWNRGRTAPMSPRAGPR